jgi:hypothetical protein
MPAEPCNRCGNNPAYCTCDPEPVAAETIEIVNWHDLYTRDDGDEAIIPQLAYRGRWTAINAPAKAGKSTFLLGVAVTTAQNGCVILYLDAEMGRADVLDRVDDWMHLKPEDLTNIHYTDLPPKLDTETGTQRLRGTIETLNPDLVIIDGLNGVVSGAENDDTPWRYLYEAAIAPMKRLGIGIVTLDNTGHLDKNRPRGHSIKIDKPDVVLNLERTDHGIKLTATHRRTSAYPVEQGYVVSNASEDGPPMTVTPVNDWTPQGTANIIVLLDRLNAPLDIGARAARRLVRENGGKGGNDAIDAARRARRTTVPTFNPGVPTPNGTPPKSPASGRAETGPLFRGAAGLAQAETTEISTEMSTGTDDDPYGVF